MKYLLRFGIQIAVIPIFVITVISSFGFTYLKKNENLELLLFDSCFNFLYNNSGGVEEDYQNSSQNYSLIFDENSNANSGDKNLFDSNPPDSTDNLNPGISVLDSLQDSLAIDTMKIDSMLLDSTARLQYFRYDRKENPYVEFRQKKPSSFFAKTDRVIQRIVKLDSTGNFVEIKEIVAGEPEKTYLKIPLEQYIELRLAAKNRDNWEQLAYKYEKKQGQDDLGKLITDITNIEIPLPSSSIFSIFGPNRINLKINGSVDIHGAWRNETTEGVTASLLGNTKNEPDFKQQVQINVSGTVGDKLSISADWNTERTFEYENQLKLKYTGYEDEIIQNIEAGNVSLQTSPLVGGSEALFGVKADFQLGPFKLTALASQKKGETEEVSVSGGSTKQKFEIHAYDYSENHYFVDDDYADPSKNIFNDYYGNANPRVRNEYYVTNLEVWKTTTGNIDQGKERKGNAFIDLPVRIGNQLYDQTYKNTGQASVAGETVINGRFVKLEEGVDYIFDEDNAHRYTGFITFKTQINPSDAIAVAYSTASQTYGEFLADVASDTNAVIVLKLIKPENLQPQFTKAWKLQLRNIYPIGGRDVKEEGFTLDINYSLPGQEPRNDYNGTKLLQAFKLDETDQAGGPNPDGAFDFTAGKTIIPSTGEIIFPVLEPFGTENIKFIGLPDTIAYQSVYDTTKTFAKRDNTKDRFIISGEYSASVTSVYNIGFNVVEKSVRVLLGGRELVEGADYSVDYNIGQVQIRNNAALVPGADLKITYEKNDLFSLASKTLLGLRGIYDFDKNTKLGFSYLNLNQQTLSDKVRIGEEPLNNTIMGADFKTLIEMPFITKGLDNFISTSAPSSLSISAEYAFMNPDPNTKKSPIASDRGESIAYIDDFEGAKKIIPIGVSYTSWSDISVPDSIGGLETLSKPGLMSYKAKTFWYNITPSDVLVQHIYGDRKQASKDAQQITALDLVYRPNQRGAYNYNPNTGDISQNWGGIMKLLSASANNLIEENIEFVEFWAQIVNAPQDAKLFLDLGQISEDVIPNNRLDTEDENGNDRIDQGEDIGLDFLTTADELIQFPQFTSDPSGDNFFFQADRRSNDPDDYVSINGTEGNAQLTEGSRSPDTEDLNRNFSLDRINSYFRYEIPLDTNRLTNEYIKGGGDNAGWYLYRVPLRDFMFTEGDPSFSVVEGIRVWITGINQEVHLRIAEFNLVGNQWQKVLTKTVTEDDTTLVLSTINYEDNPEYIKPVDVIQERDRSKPDEEVFENEQSLQLRINELEDGDKREVVKYLFRPLDLFNYSEMKMYIHGDSDSTRGSISYQENGVPKGGEVYLRFGSDTTNYYEYRMPITAGTEANKGWENLSVIFNDITAIKQLASDSVRSFPVEGKPGHFYGVKGNPTLTRVSFFLIGIENPNDGNGKISGEVWVNELRVLGADDSKGWAYSANTNLKLADLLSVGFNINQKDPNFHKLNERFGSRVDNKQWGMNVDFNLLKLIPANLSGSNLSINYQRTESISKPVYQPGTDIKIDEAAKQQEIKLINEGATPEQAAASANELIQNSLTLSTSETWTASNIKIKIPTDAWYINDIINNLTFGFNYNKKYGRNPTTAKQTGWIWNASTNYNLNLGNENYFKPLDIPYIGDVIEIFTDYKDFKIFYLPQTYNASVTAKRDWNYSLSRTTPKPNIQRDFTTSRSAGFNWQITEGGIFNWAISYNTSISSSLAYLLTIEGPDSLFDLDRSEKEIWNDVFRSAGFGKPFDFTQTFDLKTTPMLPSIWDINKYIRINTGYNVSYNWKNNFQQEELGRSAGYSSRFSAGINLRLKSLFRPLFDDPAAKDNKQAQPAAGGGRGRSRTEQPKLESDEIHAIDSLNVELDSLETSESTLDATLTLLKTITNIIFFDYEQITLNFNQTNTYASSGLKGTGTGLSNFWGISQNEDNGPSRLFMLGLSNNAGPRAPNGSLSDNFSQKNNLDFKTQKPLWEGATIDLTWNVGWGINKSTTLETDEFGNVTINNVNSTGTLDRSFLSLPNTLVFSMFGNGIKKVNELYNPDAENPTQNLSDAFVEGFESFPLLAKIPILADFAKYVPRPNWQINWTGLEKIGLFQNILTRASLTHGYSSTYSEGWKINPDGLQEIQTQRIMYGFNPLIGLNLTFQKVFDGNLSSSLKYSTRTNYSLGSSTRNITENFTKEISFTTSFSKSGFEIPMFGLSLKNDIEVSLSYTSSQNSIVIFEMDQFRDDGKPQDGTIRTTLEPRIKYIMSSRVTLSLFYKRTQVEPEGVSKIPPTTTNEAGLDVHISIN